MGEAFFKKQCVARMLSRVQPFLGGENEAEYTVQHIQTSGPVCPISRRHLCSAPPISLNRFPICRSFLPLFLFFRSPVCRQGEKEKHPRRREKSYLLPFHPVFPKSAASCYFLSDALSSLPPSLPPPPQINNPQLLWRKGKGNFRRRRRRLNFLTTAEN